MNRLNKASSPYLNQHANNPVNWYTWGQEALQKAIDLDRPILVSVGYSTCHWCHVMAHESFENEDTAVIMNELFINIKIDREERPDLDQYFMEMVQMMGVSGGWPLHVFLTPQLECFFGGTYFPPKPKYGRPSWPQILEAVSQAYKHKRNEIKTQAAQLQDHLNSLHQIIRTDKDTRKTEPLVLWNNMQTYLDNTNGGFGSAPKFPQAMAIQHAFLQYFLFANKEAFNHAVFSLKSICLGGIYDHIGGGLSRYSVDGQWNVPHFEKMLYDHALIMALMADAHMLTADGFFSYFISKSFTFFEENMKGPNGLYFSAMDADSEGEEGKYYVWTVQELRACLKGDFEAALQLIDLHDLDHFHTDKKVIRLKHEFYDPSFFETNIDKWEDYAKQLKILRNERLAPGIDHKQILGWNALMISALVKMYRSIGNEVFKSRAIDMASIITGSMKLNKEGLYARYMMNGECVGMAFLEDYSYLLQALIDVHGIDPQGHWLKEAIEILQILNTNFIGQEELLYSDVNHKQNDLPVSLKSWNESAMPNANAILAQAFRRMYLLGIYDEGLDRSENMVHAMKNTLEKYTFGLCSWANAVLMLDHFQCYVEYSDISAKLLEKIPWMPEYNIKFDEAYTDEHQLQLCINGVCHLPAKSHDEVVSLFRHVFGKGG